MPWAPRRRVDVVFLPPQSAKNFGRSVVEPQPQLVAERDVVRPCGAKSIRGQRTMTLMSGFGPPSGLHLNADQEELPPRRCARSWNERARRVTCGRLIDDDRGFTDACDEGVDLGWPALLVPEEDGGIGLGLVISSS